MTVRNRVEYSFPAIVIDYTGYKNLTGFDFGYEEGTVSDPLYVSVDNWHELHIGDTGKLHYLNGKWDFRKDKIRG